MEEIDIIELLKRVKEGRAPKEIEINGNIYNYKGFINIQYMYENNVYNMFSEGITLDTKIKILDKPIIEELPTTEIVHNFEDNSIYEREKTYSENELADKINEIIKWINNKE